MFFVDARELGEEFYSLDGHNHISNVLGVSLQGTLVPKQHFEPDPNLLRFAQWFSGQVLPGLAQTYPDRFQEPAINIQVTTAQVDTEVHRDLTTPRPFSRTFITLGITRGGTTAGTVFPDAEVRDALLEQEARTNRLDRQFVDEHFVAAPQRFATVFDPDLEVHAGPPVDRRVLYRVTVVSELPPGVTNHDIPPPNYPI